MELKRHEPLVIFKEILPTNLLTSIEKENSCNFFGPFDIATISALAAEYVVANSDGDIHKIKEVLREFLTLASEDASADASKMDRENLIHSCWLCIRMWHPGPEFVTPRWHQDGRMFTCTCEAKGVPHSKYAFVLKGPSTRLLASIPLVHEVVDNRSYTQQEIAEKLVECEEILVQRGQVIRFSWGQDDSPVHSEPDCSFESRVFVSVLFGNENELRDMALIRESEYGTSSN
jgi:hypothetical protein